MFDKINDIVHRLVVIPSSRDEVLVAVRATHCIGSGGFFFCGLFLVKRKCVFCANWACPSRMCSSRFRYESGKWNKAHDVGTSSLGYWERR